MPGWLCGTGLGFCTRDAIVEYLPIPDNSLTVVYPKSVQQMAAASAVSTAETTKIKEDFVRKSPLKTTFLTEINKDYFVIGSGNSSTVCRKLQTSNYTELIQMHKNSTQKWVDIEFPYQYPKKLGIAGYRRLEDILPNGIIPTFMKNQITPNSIVQGKFSNCYFLTALASLSEKEYRAKNLFGCPLEINKNGIYMAKLLFDGVYQEVVVDDLFPVQADGSLVGCKPMKIGDSCDIWVMILEKCWAKLLRGYQYINYRWNEQSLLAISGAPVITQILRYNEEHESNLFKYCMYNYQQNAILTCGTNATALKQQGLAEGHSYSVLGVFQIHGKQIVQLRNPWGDTEYAQKLEHNAFWDTLLPEEKSSLNMKYDTSEEDGVFYMLWQDFCKKYSTISISLIDDNAHYYYSNKEYDHEKPQYYSLEATSNEQKPIYIIFSQPCQYNHVRNQQNISYSHINVIVTQMSYDENNEFVYNYIGSYSYYSKYLSNNFFLPISSFPKGRYTFRVMVSHPEQRTTKVTVGSYSRLMFGIKPLFNVDDDVFVERSFISKATKQDQSNNKQLKYLDSAQTVRISANFQSKSNMGYFILHVKKHSPNRYRITFNQENNKELIFLGAHREEKSFHEICERGTEIVITYSYTTFYNDSHRIQYDFVPEMQSEDERPRPIPKISPII